MSRRVLLPVGVIVALVAAGAGRWVFQGEAHDRVSVSGLALGLLLILLGLFPGRSRPPGE